MALALQKLWCYNSRQLLDKNMDLTELFDGIAVVQCDKNSGRGNTTNESTSAESQKDCRLVSWCTDDVCNGSFV